jgi:hypothetical protein
LASGLLALGVFEQAQSGTDDFADVVAAAAFDLVANKGLEMGAQGKAGGHDAFLTFNNYYCLVANRLCQK